MKKVGKNARGYSLVELLVGTVLFTIIAGTVFSLLMSSQIRYSSESTVSQAFQQGNVAIDQITRDIHSAGYPPKSSFLATVANNNPSVYAQPFSWSPNYPWTPCVVNVSCIMPDAYDLIIETQISPNPVQWIRYSLQGTTLMRAVANKTPFGDPVAATNGSLTPYLENVLNGNQSLPIFTYTFDVNNPATPNYPWYIREVNISLIVQSTKRDPRTLQYPTVTITGQAVRLNPRL